MPRKGSKRRHHFPKHSVIAAAGAGLAAYGLLGPGKMGDTIIDELRTGNMAGLTGRLSNVPNPFSNDANWKEDQLLFFAGLGTVAAAILGRKLLHPRKRKGWALL